MQRTFETYKTPCCIKVGVKSKNACPLKVEAYDSRKPFTFFANHTNQIKKPYQEFDIILPQIPEILTVNIFNKNRGNLAANFDKSIEIVKFEPQPLKTYPIWLSKKDQEFINFAKKFSENAGWISYSTHRDEMPHFYGSDDYNFSIAYMDKIRDRKTKAVLNTPARIGHNSGIIDISRDAFIGYTIPMRMIILLHEYAHKWKNPLNGKAINDEIAADIAALTIYLSLGYSPLEAHYAFWTVFKGADNQLNQKRFHIIRNFIKDFTTGKLKQYYVHK